MRHCHILLAVGKRTWCDQTVSEKKWNWDWQPVGHGMRQIGVPSRRERHCYSLPFGHVIRWACGRKEEHCHCSLSVDHGGMRCDENAWTWVLTFCLSWVEPGACNVNQCHLHQAAVHHVHHDMAWQEKDSVTHKLFHMGSDMTNLLVR